MLNCSERNIQRLKGELRDKGYFKLDDETIIPTLPSSVFAELNSEPNRSNAEKVEYLDKRRQLDETKQYIKINIHMLKALLADPHLSCIQRLIWLHFFKLSYISFIDKTGDGSRTFLQQQKELADLFGCNKSTISRTLCGLEKFAYIKRQLLKKVVRIDAEGMERFCAPYQIEALFPLRKIVQLKAQADRRNLEALTEEQQLEYGLISKRQELRVAGDYYSFPLSSIAAKVDNAKLALSNANMALPKEKTSGIDAKTTPVYKEVNKNLILKNSIRDLNFARVVETKNFTDTRRDLSLTNNSQENTASQTVAEEATEACNVGVEDAPLQAPSAELRSKIIQLLQKTKEKILNQGEGKEVLAQAAENQDNDAVFAGLNIQEPMLEQQQAIASPKFEAETSQDCAGQGMSCQEEVEKTTKMAEVIDFPKSLPAKVSIYDSEGNFHYDYVPIPADPLKNPLDDIIFVNMLRATYKNLTVQEINLACEYAHALSRKYPNYNASELEEDFLYYAATYNPRDFMPKNRVKVALCNAWKLVADGKWQRPHTLAKFDALAREAKHHVEKYLEFGSRAKSADLDAVLAEIGQIQGYKCTLEGLVKEYNSYQDQFK
jgi:hypothetical protein